SDDLVDQRVGPFFAYRRLGVVVVGDRIVHGVGSVGGRDRQFEGAIWGILRFRDLLRLAWHIDPEVSGVRDVGLKLDGRVERLQRGRRYEVRTRAHLDRARKLEGVVKTPEVVVLGLRPRSGGDHLVDPRADDVQPGGTDAWFGGRFRRDLDMHEAAG